MGSAGINITGFQLQAQGAFGQFRFATNDPAKTEAWLRTTGHAFVGRDAITAKSTNRPGELGRFAQKLAASGVDIGAVYRVVPTGDADSQLLLSVADAAGAEKALGA